MKRTALVLASLGFSTFAFAALTAASSPSEVTVPQLPGGLFFGVTGLYLQPSINNGDLDYATVQNFSVSTGSNLVASPQVARVEPGYDWAWGANLGYEFPQTGNDINLSYMHLDTKDSDSVAAKTNQVVLPVRFSFFDQFVSTGSATAKIDLDQVDLVGGQTVLIGQRLTLHPNVGLRYADVQRKLQANFSEPEFLPNLNGDIESYTSTSKFWGIGPLAGVDMSYYVGAGISISSHFDSGILIGDINTNANTIDILSPFPPPAPAIIHPAEFRYNSNNRLVPVADAKLGAAFTYHFDNNAASYLTVEGGYQASKYFNAIDGITRPNPAAVSFPRKSANLLIDGPYASVTAHL